MLRIPIKRKSELITILILGFSFLITLLVFLAYTSHQQMKISYETIVGSSRASDKMEIIVNLVETARTRTRLTLQMIHEEDPFVKDEIGLELDKYAAQFARLRAALIKTGLSAEEQHILDNQAEATAPTLALQRQAAEMAISDDPETVKKAQKILIEDVYTGQGVIIDYFMQLINYQKDIIDKSRDEVSSHYKSALRVQLTIFTVILILAGTVAFYVIKRTIETEKELFLEKEKARITLKSIGDAVITTDKNGLVDYLNPVAEKITGFITHEARNKLITEVFRAYDETNQRWLADCIINFLKQGSYNMPSNDIVLYNANNDIIDISLTIAPIQDEHNIVYGTITTFQDISKEKIMAKRIEHQARHDVLTGLLNRREFETKVEQALALYSEGTTHALCVIDLDRFKIVNDTLGHAAGDELLRQISQRIKQTLRQTDLFARIGGDEFALFLSNVNVKDAERIADKIITVVREYQFVWGNKAFRIGASLGVVDAPAQVSNYENLYHAADTACYMAKHEGRDRIHSVTYDDAHVAEKREQTQWVNRINEALDENRFTLYSQNICPLSDNPLLKPHKEVLIRMLNEDGEIVPPMAFIPPAERYNLMPRLDEWVINNVIQQIKRDESDTVYAINLSGQSMADKKFSRQVIDEITSSDIEHNRLCFEITETSAIANLENAREFLSSLQQLGCYTALDDFGSGLSSFAYLRTLPIHYLKIDGMFIKQISEDPTSRVMVEAIHSIGRTMNIMTIAEFVENEETRDLLQKMGIDYAQGYYFDAPAPMV